MQNCFFSWGQHSKFSLGYQCFESVTVLLTTCEPPLELVLNTWLNSVFER